MCPHQNGSLFFTNPHWKQYGNLLPGASGPPGQFSLPSLIKNNKEISSRELRDLQVNFSYLFLLSLLIITSGPSVMIELFLLATIMAKKCIVKRMNGEWIYEMKLMQSDQSSSYSYFFNLYNLSLAKSRKFSNPTKSGIRFNIRHWSAT